MTEREIRYITTVIASCVVIGIFFIIRMVAGENYLTLDTVKAGFVLDGDESSPYSANFLNAINVVRNEYDDKLEVVIKTNVRAGNLEETINELLEKDNCDLIISNSSVFGETLKNCAAKYPDVQFCAATCDNANTDPVYSNYHTFMGEIYQGRYVAGIVAGLKLNEMISEGEITEDEALVGYVGAFPCAEVISGYTAFILGVRSECSSAKMLVRYTESWGDYALERDLARKFIEEGCVIISQHSDTIGPAIACEKARVPHNVYHIGYNQDMINVAPTSSLTGCKIDWSSYISSAINSLLNGKSIEKEVEGDVHGNDSGAGFADGWVKMLDINKAITPAGTDTIVENAIKAIEEGRINVFEGDYTGVKFDDPGDKISLSSGYKENYKSSAPTFSYILDDVVTVEQ